MLLVLGTVGAVLSGTRLSPLFVLTLVLLYALWTTGARLPPLTRLITPAAALFGVLLALVFLVFALFDLDLFSTLRGVEANRAAGLFLEPSHLALYVMPLWLIAFARPAFRPLLWACMLLFVATQFTFSMVGVLGGFIALKLLLDSKSLRHTLFSMLKVLLVVSAALVLIYSVPDLIVINGIELATYINNRIFGFVARAGDENFSLSPLVIVQGVELATLSLISSSGLGVGLGNMGINEAIYSQSPTRDILIAVTADFESLNLRDGGILLNKLAAELGFMVLPFLWLLARAAMRIRTMPHSHARHVHIVLGGLALALLLVRALPYFAAPTCLVILSLASLTHLGPKRRKRKSRTRAQRRSAPQLAAQM
ncbi:hypothetical protein [Piscinibacter sakaiensis]|uniref:hypothetical protein n=1 Tax=Piscinibacter sakaiensis TaxID=1547922 RepID=UPI003AABBBB5